MRPASFIYETRMDKKNLLGSQVFHFFANASNAGRYFSMKLAT